MKNPAEIFKCITEAAKIHEALKTLTLRVELTARDYLAAVENKAAPNVIEQLRLNALTTYEALLDMVATGAKQADELERKLKSK